MGDGSTIEELYSKPDLTRKVRFHAKEQKTTEEDDTHATIYDNYVAEMTPGDTVQDTVQEQQQTGICPPAHLLSCKNGTELAIKISCLPVFQDE